MVSIITEHAYLKSRLLLIGNTDNDYEDENFSILQKCAWSNGSIFSDTQPILSNKTGQYNETCMQQVYFFPEKNYYAVISTYVGSCTGCIKKSFIDIIEDLVSRAYVTTDKEEAIRYYEAEKLKNLFE